GRSTAPRLAAQNIVRRADDGSSPGKYLRRFRQNRPRRRHKRLPLVERNNGIDNNFPRELPFEIGDHLGMSFVGHRDDDKVGTFDRGLIGCSFYSSGAQTRLESFNGLFGLLRIARSDDNLYAWRPKTQRQCATEVSSSTHNRYRKRILHMTSRNGEKDLPPRGGEAPLPIPPLFRSHSPEQ